MKQDTLVTITTTRETTFTLSQLRTYFGIKMNAAQMRRELTEDNGQLAGLYVETFGANGLGVITHQTFTVEPFTETEA
jgi:hypothetical protein